MGKIWAVCSGSGGVGKTTLALSLAAYSAKQGKSVILLDAAGLSRSCDLALGLENIVTLDASDVLSRQADMKAALYPVKQYGNMYLACASLHNEFALSELSGVILAMQSMCDLLIIDLPTGQALENLDVMTSQDARIFIVRPDDACMRAADQMIQRVRMHEANRIVVVNQMKKERIKRGVQYASDVVSTILDCIVAGTVAFDEHLTLCGAKGKTAFEADGSVRHAIRDIVAALS